MQQIARRAVPRERFGGLLGGPFGGQMGRLK